jgi:hypothetical protein
MTDTQPPRPPSPDPQPKRQRAKAQLPEEIRAEIHRLHAYYGTTIVRMVPRHSATATEARRGFPYWNCSTQNLAYIRPAYLASQSTKPSARSLILLRPF